MSLFDRLAGTTLASFAISISSANATLTTFPGAALTDVPAASLTITSQAPFTSAVTNLVPGNVILNVPAPVGAGAFGWLQMRQGGTNVLQFGNLVGQSIGTVGAIYAGGVNPSGTNYSFYTTSSGSTTVVSASSTLALSGGGLGSNLVLTSTGVAMNLPALNWTAGVSAPTLTQSTPTTDVATQNITFTSQAPFASATVNKSSGSFIFNNPAPISGGLYGLTKHQFAGTDCVTIGTYAGVTGGSTSYGTIWFMDAGTPTTTNFGFLGNQSITYLNNPTQVTLSIGGASGTGLDLTSATAIWHPATHEWLATVASPTWTQVTAASDVATQNLTISSQAPFASAVTNVKGGNVVLSVPLSLSGTPQAFVQFNSGSNIIGGIGPFWGAPSTNTNLWLLPAGTAATASNYTMTASASSVVLNGVTSVNVNVNGQNVNATTATAYAWGSAVASPLFTQTALASTSAGAGAAGQTTTHSAQAGQAATGGTNAGGTGGSLTFSPGQGGTSGGGANGPAGVINFNAPTPLSGTGFGTVNFQTNGVTYLSVGSSASGAANITGGVGTGNITLATTTGNAGLVSTASAGYVQLNSTNNNIYLGGAQIVFRNGANTTTYGQWGALLATGSPLGGYSTTPFSFSGQTSPNTVACGTGGTQTISAAQSIIPFFLVTTGILTSAAIVDFTTNASTGFFIIDLQGVGTIGVNTLGFKNGTKTLTFTSSQFSAFQATGMTAIAVCTYGANNITFV
jgi:hypothetical protein